MDDTFFFPATEATDVSLILERIHEMERVRLHSCLHCSQAEHLLKDLYPFLSCLEVLDYDSYLKECHLLADGLLSFLQSYLYTVIAKYDPANYFDHGDCGLSELEVCLLEADALISAMSFLDLNEEDVAALKSESETVRCWIVYVEATRKKVLRLTRQSRVRYYYDGPGKALLLILGFIALFLLMKKCG